MTSDGQRPGDGDDPGDDAADERGGDESGDAATDDPAVESGDEPESTRTAWYFAAAALILFPLALGALWFGWRCVRSGNRWGWAPMVFSLLGPVTLIVLTSSGSG